MADIQRIRDLIRDVPDFPKPGIVYKDITPVLADAPAMAAACRELAAPFRDAGVTRVLGIESRGFIFGTPVAAGDAGLAQPPCAYHAPGHRASPPTVRGRRNRPTP